MEALTKLFKRKKVSTVDPAVATTPEFFSPDAVYSNEASESDIFSCFRLILGRNPSPEEWAGHTGALTGKPLKEVMLSYLTSAEFKERDLLKLDPEEIKIVDVHGYRMYVPINDPQVGATVYQHQSYEPHIEKFFKDNVRDGDCVIDIGANIGFFSLLAASLVGSKGKVYSFEPYSENVKFIHLSKEINSFSQIEILPMAASNKNGLCLFDNAGTNGFIRDITSKDTRVFNSTPVYMTTLDSQEISECIKFIKIDTEGAEFLALSGAIDLIENQKPTVVSEFSPEALKATSRVSAETYLDLFLTIEGYKVYIFKGLDLVQCTKKEDVLAAFYESGCDHIDIVFSVDNL